MITLAFAHVFAGQPLPECDAALLGSNRRSAGSCCAGPHAVQPTWLRHAAGSSSRRYAATSQRRATSPSHAPHGPPPHAPPPHASWADAHATYASPNVSWPGAHKPDAHAPTPHATWQPAAGWPDAAPRHARCQPFGGALGWNGMHVCVCGTAHMLLKVKGTGCKHTWWRKYSGGTACIGCIIRMPVKNKGCMLCLD